MNVTIPGGTVQGTDHSGLVGFTDTIQIGNPNATTPVVNTPATPNGQTPAPVTGPTTPGQNGHNKHPKKHHVVHHTVKIKHHPVHKPKKHHG